MKNFQIRPEYLTKIPKIDKLAVPNKSVQGGSLVEIKSGLQVRLFRRLEYVKYVKINWNTVKT